jgi:ribosomal protein L37AE/L43A
MRRRKLAEIRRGRCGNCNEDKFLRKDKNGFWLCASCRAMTRTAMPAKMLTPVYVIKNSNCDCRGDRPCSMHLKSAGYKFS